MAAIKLFNLCRVATSTAGTGTITLGSAVTGFLSFANAGVSDGDTVRYAIKDGSNSEIGYGVYTASGTTLTRNVLKSNNSNNPIVLSGSAEVFITAAAEDFMQVAGWDAGTVSLPSIFAAGDTNTGMWFPGADIAAISTGGTERVRYHSTALVSFHGATNPALKIDGTASSAATGLAITAQAAASGVDLSAISSGTNENLTINAKGSGTVSINPTGTGAINLSRVTSILAGIVTAPGLYFTGDTNTGLWAPAADTMALSTGGSERVRVDSSGNVGIGMTPVYKLDVTGNINIDTASVFKVGGVSILKYSNSLTNIAVGTAIPAITTGSGNVAVGYGAGASWTTDGGNVAIGLNALTNTVAANTADSRNTAVGRSAMQTNTTGYYNSAFGETALFGNTTGGFNLGIGTQAGYANSTGSNNVYIGLLSGFRNAANAAGNAITGSGNIIIGTNGNMIPSETGSNQLNIGNLIFGTGLATGATVSTGNVGIGTTGPGYKLSIGDGTGSANGAADMKLWTAAPGSNTGASATIRFSAGIGGGFSNSAIAGIQSYLQYQSNTNALAFHVGAWNNNDTLGTARMVITDTAVGIGTTSPGALLDVNGHARMLSMAIQGAGTVEAGGIVSTSNWGMLFIAKQASPAAGEFGWCNSSVTELMRLTSPGNLKIGGSAARGTTEGTNQLVIFNGTAPAGTLTNGASFYAASGEMRVMDSAGNSTLLSPHDHVTNEWIYHSARGGKVLRIDMERLMRKLNDMFGGGFVHDLIEEAA